MAVSQRDEKIYRLRNHKYWSGVLSGLNDGLLAWYAMEEKYASAIGAVNSVPPNSMTLFTVNSPGAGTEILFTKSVAGKIGKGAAGIEAANTVALQAAEHPISILNANRTFAFWARIPLGKGERSWFKKEELAIEYRFGRSTSTGKWTLLSAADTVEHSEIPDLGTWYFVVVWFDTANSKAYISINNGLPQSGAFTVTLQAGAPFSAAVGAVEMDELAIWNRILTADEIRLLYNNGDGLSYDDFAKATVCREVSCCEECL